MFLSPLNWHYAKFTTFQWKSAQDTDVRMAARSATDNRRAARPPASTVGVTSREALVPEATAEEK